MVLTILVFIAVLASLVLVHEFGHFWAAKKAGCDVEEFGIGFPPRLWSFKKNETVYSINLFPVGGFVKIKGENGDENPTEKSFVKKSFGWKSLIISAGVLMNVLLAFVLITINLIIGVPTEVVPGHDYGRFAKLSNHEVMITELIKDAPAQQAGLLPGDTIVAVQGQGLTTVDAAIKQLSSSQGQPITIVYKRGEETKQVSVTPAMIAEIGHEGIGVGLSETATFSYPWYVAPFFGVARTLEIIWLIISAFAQMIGNLFAHGAVPSDVAGPIGIAVLTGQVARLGFTHLMQFAALLSLNLAVINILPLPALDGGRLAMIVYERLRGRKLKLAVEHWIHIVGFAFLILLMIAVTAKDLFTYGGGIWQSVSNFFSFIG